MIQEEKQLLLKDLCGRLPYGVKCQWDTYYNGILIDVCKCKTKNNFVYWDCYFEECGDDVPIEIVKPYLRSMSSMTEDEKEKFINLRHKIELGVNIDLRIYNYLNFLYSHHIDVNDRLLCKKLALEAPEDMYKID